MKLMITDVILILGTLLTLLTFFLFSKNVRWKSHQELWKTTETNKYYSDCSL